MKKVFLGALCSSVLAVAGDLWGPDPDEFEALQVKVPSANECWAANPERIEGNPCYKSTAGWWFGYTDQEATTQVKLNGDWVNFGKGVSLSDESDGTSFIESDRLSIKFSTKAATASDAPSIAGIGFNFKEPEGPDNISNKTGYCIRYSSTEALQFELGWNETALKYDTWFATLPKGENKAVNMTWDLTKTTGKTSGDFKKDGYATGEFNKPISEAVERAFSLKIRLKNGSTTSGVNADFELYELGWAGTCTGTPITSNPLAANSLKFELIGKTLSISTEKPVSVQIINLHGALVHSQTIGSNDKVNLNALPTGIYMVRIPSLGYVNKIAVK